MLHYDPIYIWSCTAAVKTASDCCHIKLNCDNYTEICVVFPTVAWFYESASIFVGQQSSTYTCIVHTASALASSYNWLYLLSSNDFQLKIIVTIMWMTL